MSCEPHWSRVKGPCLNDRVPLSSAALRFCAPLGAAGRTIEATGVPSNSIAISTGDTQVYRIEMTTPSTPVRALMAVLKMSVVWRGIHAPQKRYGLTDEAGDVPVVRL